MTQRPDKQMTIMRGLPGSGKSHLARRLGGLVLSTDDFYVSNGAYRYDHARRHEAHAWNQARALMAVQRGNTHVVIDNTCSMAWEARPYVEIAVAAGYAVRFMSPRTPWAWNVAECAKRNSHGVSLESIAAMLRRWERGITVEQCLTAMRET